MARLNRDTGPGASGHYLNYLPVFGCLEPGLGFQGQDQNPQSAHGPRHGQGIDPWRLEAELTEGPLQDRHCCGQSGEQDPHLQGGMKPSQLEGEELGRQERSGPATLHIRVLYVVARALQKVGNVKVQISQGKCCFKNIPNCRPSYKWLPVTRQLPDREFCGRGDHESLLVCLARRLALKMRRQVSVFCENRGYQKYPAAL